MILSHLVQIRRRSTILWNGLPKENYDWRPDEKAMSAIEMVRHVLQADYGWNIIINRGDMSDYSTPWEGHPYGSVTEEISFAAPYREEFLSSIRNFTDEELENSEVIHPGNGMRKQLGQYLLRVGFHESVHAGQFITYMRAMEIEIPFIWD